MLELSNLPLHLNYKKTVFLKCPACLAFGIHKEPEVCIYFSIGYRKLKNGSCSVEPSNLPSYRYSHSGWEEGYSGRPGEKSPVDNTTEVGNPVKPARQPHPLSATDHAHTPDIGSPTKRTRKPHSSAKNFAHTADIENGAFGLRSGDRRLCSRHD